MAFDTRQDAGRLLAAELSAYTGSDAVVVGLTRGGIVVGREVAQALRLPFDALVMHTITIMDPDGVRRRIAVVAEPDHLVVQHDRLRECALPPGWLDEAVAQGIREVRRRGRAYRGSRDRWTLAGRPVILVDDAVALGTTLQAAIAAVRATGPREIVLAVPVAPAHVLEALRPHVERVICLAAPADLIGGNVYYPLPGEVTDDEIQRLLN